MELVTNMEFLLEYLLTTDNDEDNINGHKTLSGVQLKRSYWAMSLLCSDLKQLNLFYLQNDFYSPFGAGQGQRTRKSSLFNPEKAASLAKSLFRALNMRAIGSHSNFSGKENMYIYHEAHIQKLLSVLLSTFPSTTIQAFLSSFPQQSCSDQGLVSFLLQQELEESHMQCSVSNGDNVNLLVSIILRNFDIDLTLKPQQMAQLQQQLASFSSQDSSFTKHQLKLIKEQYGDIIISRSHRRKFVKMFCDWDIFGHMMNAIYYTSASATDSANDYILQNNLRETISDAIIQIIEGICFPLYDDLPQQQQSQISTLSSLDDKKKKFEAQHGEDIMMKPLGKEEYINELLYHAIKPSRKHDNTGSVTSKILMDLFQLCTGKRQEKKRNNSQEAIKDTTEDGLDNNAQKMPVSNSASSKDSNTKTSQPPSLTMNKKDRLEYIKKKQQEELLSKLKDIDLLNKDNNRLKEWGVTIQIYQHLCSSHNLQMLMNGIMIAPESKLFTTQRLNLITLFADLLEYGYTSITKNLESESKTNGPNEESNTKNKSSKQRQKQKNTQKSGPNIEEIYSNLLCVASSMNMEKKSKTDCDKNGINPLIFLIDLLFEFPENNLYHYQFYRIFFHILRSSSLLTTSVTSVSSACCVMIQKSKFITRAISGLKSGLNKVNEKKDKTEPFLSQPCGILLLCLNAVRLQYMSAPSLNNKSNVPWSLPHYLDSHDLWKKYLKVLIE